MSLERCLQEIEDESTSLTHALVFELCNLTHSEVERFSSVWTRVSAPRKHKVIECLSELSQDSAELDFSALFIQCLKDEDVEVRQKAIEGLWEFEDRSLIPTLCALLKQDSSSKVRAAAALALGKFASLTQEGKLLAKDSERVKECLLEALQDEGEDLDVRRRSLEAVAILNTNQVMEYIKWAYKSDNLALKCSSLYAMGKTGEPFWLAALVKELKSPEPSLQYEAANACAELEEESAVPHLIPLIHDDELQVQLSAIRAIGVIGGPLAKKTLRRYIRSGDPAIEEAARDSLEMVDAMEDPLTFKYRP